MKNETAKKCYEEVLSKYKEIIRFYEIWWRSKQQNNI